VEVEGKGGKRNGKGEEGQEGGKVEGKLEQGRRFAKASPDKRIRNWRFRIRNPPAMHSSM